MSYTKTLSLLLINYTLCLYHDKVNNYSQFVKHNTTSTINNYYTSDPIKKEEERNGTFFNKIYYNAKELYVTSHRRAIIFSILCALCTLIYAIIDQFVHV